MIDSLLFGKIFGIIRHNLWDLMLIFWSLKCIFCKKTYVMTKTDSVIVLHGWFNYRTILTARNQNILEAPNLKCHQGYTWVVLQIPTQYPYRGALNRGEGV